ncbi:MAG: ferrous iron transport protein B [Sphingobacteriaceae bacterium]|nr:ferrous iron transport protein B [Sphingobacteriaceae bacterium]
MPLQVLLAGNPNAGKSSLFNALTGLSQKTGNYAGVTVDKYEGFFRINHQDKNYSVNLIDLPGIYSLNPKTIDEHVAFDNLVSEKNKPDVVVVVVDAGNLKRNLLLATQVIDLKYKTVVVLNMMDEAEKQNISININGLQEKLGVPVVAVNSRTGEGIEGVKTAILNATVSHSHFYDMANLKSKTYSDLLISEKNNRTFHNQDQMYRINLIRYLINSFVQAPTKLFMREFSKKIDSVITHKIFGYLFLIFILFLIFQSIFFIAEYPMEWIESAFIKIQSWLQDTLPQGALSDLLVNGIVSGLSGVFIFIPQIALLFLFVGILEDTGYMARAGFIMDKIMRRFGLNGRSVIPLISGTACAVPSIMATRSISNFKERLITVFIIPLVSCSARLPVYILIVSLLYPNDSDQGFFHSKGLVLLLLYLIGFTATFLTAFFLNKLIPNKESSVFIMELPIYRFPHIKNLLFLVYNKVKVFVFEAGKIIMAISIILWFLSSYGYSEKFRQTDLALTKALAINQTDSLTYLQAQKLEHSFVGSIGRKIEPLIKPMGFDWKIGIALITSFAAREVFVGSMATIYSAGNEGSIRDKLMNETDSSGKKIYTPAVCWSLLLFYSFALQCMSTIAIVKRETKSWKWTGIQFLYMSALAYFSALIAYQLLS